MKHGKLLFILLFLISSGVAATQGLQRLPERESRERLGFVARHTINQLFNDFFRDEDVSDRETEEIRLQRLCYQLGQTTQAAISFGTEFGLPSENPELRKETENSLVMAISLAGFCHDSTEHLILLLPKDVQKEISGQIFSVTEKETVWEILNQLILFSRQ